LLQRPVKSTVTPIVGSLAGAAVRCARQLAESDPLGSLRRRGFTPRVALARISLTEDNHEFSRRAAFHLGGRKPAQPEPVAVDSRIGTA
jgi:hypothetical protein